MRHAGTVYGSGHRRRAETNTLEDGRVRGRHSFRKDKRSQQAFGTPTPEHGINLKKEKDNGSQQHPRTRKG